MAQTIRSLAPTITLVFLATIGLAACSSSGTTSMPSWPDIDGYWEGEFMPGNDLTLVLDFTTDEEGRQAARVLLFEGRTQIQDDSLTHVRVHEGALSFYISAKNTPFEGHVEPDSGLIRGRFQFPDRSLHPVLVKRVAHPSLGHFARRDLPSFENPEPDAGAFAPEALREDMAFLQEQLERLHPQAYRYVSRDAFRREKRRISAALDSSLSAVDFARRLAPWIASVGCAHTGVRIPRPVAQSLEEQVVFLPLDIQLMGERLLVIRNHSDAPGLFPGAEILSINGRSAADIRTRLLAAVPSDAGREAYKRFQINQDVSRMYAHLIEAPPTFKIVFRPHDGAERSVELAGTSYRALTASRAAFAPGATPAGMLPFSFEMLQEESAALLTISAFWAPDDSTFSRFLADAFAELDRSGTDNLILDLRGNQGGPPSFAAELLAYLIPAPVAYFERAEPATAPTALYEPINPRPMRFGGSLFVLVDGGCVSTTGHLLSLIRYHSLGVLVGEEPGGNFTCNDNSLALQLPHSKLEVRIARTTFRTAVENDAPDAPLSPDYVVGPELDDYVRGIDRVLAFTLELLRERRLTNSPASP